MSRAAEKYTDITSFYVYLYNLPYELNNRILLKITAYRYSAMTSQPPQNLWPF